MVGIAQISILSADSRPEDGQLRIDERADQGDGATYQPRTQYKHRRVHLRRDYRWVNEDPGADDAAHHDHGRVERTEAAGERRFVSLGAQFLSRTNSRLICKSSIKERRFATPRFKGGEFG